MSAILGALAGLFEIVFKEVFAKVWEQLQKEDTVDEVEGTIDSVDLHDDPDDLLDDWVLDPDPDGGGLREGDQLA